MNLDDGFLKFSLNYASIVVGHIGALILIIENASVILEMSQDIFEYSNIM